jgi:hypothetical protein
MSEEKALAFSKRFPHGPMVLPEEPKPAKKAAPKKKKAAKKAKKE